MSISSVRSSPASLTRAPAQASAVSRPPSLSGPAEGAASGQKVGGKGSPLMAALQQDGFDAGGAGKAEGLGKLLEGALSVLSSITQLLQSVTEGVQGLTGAQGASGGSPFSDSFSQGSTGPSPLSLDSSSLEQGADAVPELSGDAEAGQASLQDPTFGMSQVPSLA
ncbi:MULTISPECIES: hypothetical protein [Corallococcus]|uniref:hypothetical protein n=1 Tax=Corallococcus TaxID=83461 RepID=UPI00117C1FB2|nr:MULTISPECIES: hypothetical protein [Corallococcus]NBD07944.1 hypothetical protein [Corallococcus silvisoli]TSC33926.1 hypothetical protein FOF48_02435 [Corallococcus sp. Z5C101001]